MHNSGVLDDVAYGKITKRHFGAVVGTKAEALTDDEIRALRERMSQAVFVRNLNLTLGCVSHLERGAKRPRRWFCST